MFYEVYQHDGASASGRAKKIREFSSEDEAVNYALKKSQSLAKIPIFRRIISQNPYVRLIYVKKRGAR